MKFLMKVHDDKQWGELEAWANDGQLIVTSFGDVVTDQIWRPLRESLELEFIKEIEGSLELRSVAELRTKPLKRYPGDGGPQ